MKGLDVNGTIAQSCGDVGARIVTSMIGQYMKKMGYFGRELFEKRMVIE